MNYQYLWRNLVRSWVQGFRLQFVTLCVLTGTYVVIALGLLGLFNMNRILSLWGDHVRISVYFTDEATQEDISKVKSFLKKEKHVKDFYFISKDRAAELFLTQLSSLSKGLSAELKSSNPLPRSFEVSLVKSVKSTLIKELKRLSEKLGRFSGVDDVSYGQGWIENYAQVLNGFSLTGVLIISVLILGGLFVIGNVIRSTIYQRREEIELLELFGAPSHFIKIPFVIEGAVLGFLSSIFALLICYAIYVWQSRIFMENLGFLGINEALSYMHPLHLVLFTFVGMFIGGLGSFLVVRNINSGWAASEGQL
ncbi:MAG: FtsX-like permease family protein [Bdellovibrio sp.]|nr:MAG: FtsX-like permease family protein [Bdellovibrio sp.]